MHLLLATSTSAGHLDPDLPLISAAANRAGHTAHVAVWDDPSVDWSAADLVIVRSCWDYVGRREEFLDWASGIARLENPASVLRWNTDKTYLRELAAAGVPVIETRWNVRTGDDLGDHAEWVVKPTISAGSADTARWSDPRDVYRHSEALLEAGRPTMVQPYVESVDVEGETALLHVDGTFSHAIGKGAMLVPGTGPRHDPPEEITERTPEPEQLRFGEAVVAAAVEITGHVPLYARVDVVRGPDGDWQLMELELTEPSLFLDHTAHGADRLVAAAARR